METSAAQRAIYRLVPSWREELSGDLVQGGALTVDYDPDRLGGCRGSRGGMPAWDLRCHLRFWPSGEGASGDLLRHLASGASGPQVLDPPEPVSPEFTLPLDAVEAELWFENTDVFGCRAWDSRYGANYRLPVTPGGPARPVARREGAIPSLEVVNALGSGARKLNTFTQPPSDPRAGLDMETHLSVEAWVRNLAYEKSAWIDVHVFDAGDALIHAETLTLGYAGPAEGRGDRFAFDGRVYQGVQATPGSAEPRPDARKVQFRLYVELAGRVWTDAILHQHEVPPDGAVR